MLSKQYLLTLACSKSTIETLERCQICSKLAIKTPERRQWRQFGLFIVTFGLILHFFSSVSTVDFEQVNVSWVLV